MPSVRPADAFAQVLAVEMEQVERDEDRPAAPVEQIQEDRPALLIEADELSVEHGPVTAQVAADRVT